MTESDLREIIVLRDASAASMQLESDIIRSNMPCDRRKKSIFVLVKKDLDISAAENSFGRWNGRVRKP